MPIPNDLRRRKALGGMFSNAEFCFLATSTVMFQLLWRYRPRKIGPGCVCVIYIHTPSCTLPLWRGTRYGFGVHVIIRTRTISPAKAFESKARCLVQTAQPVINSSMMKKRLLPLWRRLGFVVVLCDLDYGSGVSPSLLAFFFFPFQPLQELHPRFCGHVDHDLDHLYPDLPLRNVVQDSISSNLPLRNVVQDLYTALQI